MYSNLNKENTHILIITSILFKSKIEKELIPFDLPINYFILDLHTLMDASCCKLNIFQYEHINLYQKILYLDTDILINSDINILFNLDILPNKIYTLEEGTINFNYWGAQFFDFTKIDKNTPAFSAGILYFHNNPEIRSLFINILNHIQKSIINNKELEGLDQPFVVYNAITQSKYDNQLLKYYIENNPKNIDKNKIIYHFPGGPGNYSSKYNKMTDFLNKITEFNKQPTIKFTRAFKLLNIKQKFKI